MAQTAKHRYPASSIYARFTYLALPAITLVIVAHLVHYDSSQWAYGSPSWPMSYTMAWAILMSGSVLSVVATALGWLAFTFIVYGLKRVNTLFYAETLFTSKARSKFIAIAALVSIPAMWVMYQWLVV